jgi:hypothetical protein
VTDLTAAHILSAFTHVAARDATTSIEDRLIDTGWVEMEPGSGGLHRQWRKEEIVARQFGRGSNSFLEVTTDLAKRDPDDPDSEDRLTAEFEARFQRNLAEITQVLGAASFVGTYGDEGFPEEIDAVMTARWSTGDGAVELNFKHEDWGVPFRITATVR